MNDEEDLAFTSAYRLKIVVEGLQWLEDARVMATSDAVLAESMRSQIGTFQASLLARKTLVESFSPSATYSQAQMNAIKNELLQIYAILNLVVASIEHSNEWRQKVDMGLVRILKSVEWLARQQTGQYNDTIEEV